jgi:phage terminase small subunit
VLALEEQLARATKRLEALERRSREMREEMETEVERVRQSFKAELVPYKASTAIVRVQDVPSRHRIPVERDDGATGRPGPR